MPFELIILGGLSWFAGAKIAKNLGDDPQQPSYRPAAGYPPVQYAENSYQPQMYGQVNFVQEQPLGRPGAGRVTVFRSPENGMFVANARIESAITGTIVFPAILDTGAANSFITHDVALRYGLNLDRLTYCNRAITPTGRGSFSGFTLPDLALVQSPHSAANGYVCVDHVRVGVLREDTLGMSILGLSFLEKLRVSISGETMILSQ